MKALLFYNLFFCLYYADAQQKIWPDIYPSKGDGGLYNRTRILDGYVVFKKPDVINACPFPNCDVKSFIEINADTIAGEIKLTNPYSIGNKPFCSLRIPDTSKTIKIIYFGTKQIKKITVFGFSKNYDSVNFINLTYRNKEKIWRQLGSKNEISIYDNWIDTNPNNNFGATMIMENKNERVKVYSEADNWVHFFNTKKLLKKFIKKRYHLKIHGNDFKSQKNMIDFILENEYDKARHQLL